MITGKLNCLWYLITCPHWQASGLHEPILWGRWMWLIKLPQDVSCSGSHIIHADVVQLYQLQWADSGLKPAITLLTSLENLWNRKTAFIQNAELTREKCSWTVLWECSPTFYLWLLSCAWETIGLDWLFCSRLTLHVWPIMTMRY